MTSSGTSVIRIVAGTFLLAHGLQKATTRWGGKGLAATGAGFEHLGLRPGRHHAVAAAATEIGSGVSLVLGAATPAGAAGLTGTMTVAAGQVHRRNGLWAPMGMEYNLILMTIAYGLTASGPGRPSVDARWFPRLSGHRWALAQLVAGAAGGLAVMAAARRQAPPSGGGPDERG